MSSGPDGEVCTVVLRQLPVRLWVQSKQHHDELLREFALLTAGTGQDACHQEVPARLVSLVSTLRQQYSADSEERDAVLFEADADGVEQLDVHLPVPVAAAAAVEGLGALLDEADDFCRQGRHLLTLASPAEVVAFRRWYLREITAQVAGANPTPWPGRAGC